MQGGQNRDEQGFVTTYDQGPPCAGISDDKAIGRDLLVAPEFPPAVYQQSVQDALSRTTPELVI
jgi:hypothetical protein